MVGLVVLILWEGIVRLAQVPSFILPAPSDVIATFFSRFGELMSAARVTTVGVFGGILMGGALAVIASLIVSLFERFAKTALVLVAIISCAPVVALAPIFNAWFGATNIFSKISVAAIMVFFPVMVNTTRGLLAVTPLHRELLDSLGASRGQLLRFVRIPGALPSLIDGLKVGSTLAVIGIIVAEYFGGTANALGVMIANSAALSQFSLTWAAVFAASILGLTAYGLVLLLGRTVVPWKQTAL
ncbi:ABC transporter permease subunit [Leucobacter allii]|uniref:ABC transporter permease n=1 Tax=Leucobacter allii TaxID=2932247 RepID=UPI001FD2061C|nr:ABC transporter permease subunit [Leucobacter allii]UOR02196.1 ABC transporter permease subunit [Leucobacter allii]